MNESEFTALQEISWRRPLTPVEEAQVQVYLATHPEAQAEWESDLALNSLLADLPQARLSSNFTAQVLLALDQDQVDSRRRSTRSDWRSWLTRFFPRARWATAAIAMGLLGIWQYGQHQKTERWANLNTVFQTIPKESAMLQDFDAIQRLGQAPVMDEKLWVALSATAQ